MKKLKASTLKRKNNYWINIDKYLYENLTRTQVAFICLIDKLNKGNIIATNDEIGASLGITPKYTKRLIERINSKVPGLINVKYDTLVNYKGQIKINDPNKIYKKSRSISLAKPLHQKGNEYINLPNFVVTKISQFLSGNELKVLAYLKAMPQGSFSGFLRVISNKLELSLGIIKRALKKLAKLKAIFRLSVPRLHKLKNIYYTVNTIKLNNNWFYKTTLGDEPKVVKKRKRKKYKITESIDQLIAQIGSI